MTPDGRKLWNEEAPWGEKVYEATKYALLEVAPLSAKQFERLNLAAQELPGKRGEKYELDDELAGFYGLRAIKIDPIESLNYKINEFKEGLRDTRSLFTSKVLKGRPLERDEIIKRYILANERRFRVFQNLQRKMNAADILGASKKDMRDLFDRRQEPKNYNAISRNKFIPFGITEKTEEAAKLKREKVEDVFDNIDLPPGLDRRTIRELRKIERRMQRLRLDDNFYDEIIVEDYLGSVPTGMNQVASSAQPLSQQPMPVVQQQPVQQFFSATGLTPTENALLSEEEKQIRLRQRGMV